jgi:hypothetical protein
MATEEAGRIMTEKPASTDAAEGEGGTTISFSVPSWVVEGREMTPEAFARWVRIAAALAGMSQAEFMRVLKEAKQDTVVIDWDDFDRELAELALRRPPDGAGG